MAKICKFIIDGLKIRSCVNLKFNEFMGSFIQVKMLKIRYFGHVMRAHQCLEKVIMLGITAGARKKREAVYAMAG